MFGPVLIGLGHVGVIAPAWAKGFLDLFLPAAPFLPGATQLPFSGNVWRQLWAA